jgi:hypothetical protein
MTALATAERPQAAPPPSRTIPFIDPANVVVDSSGYVRKSLVVRLPKDFVADDLKELEVWRKVQKSGRSLCQFDTLFLISWDQSWAAEAIVSQAAAGTATLAGVRIIQTPQRAKALFRDDTYAVVWGGAGYHVERIKDGQKMSGTVVNDKLAERDLAALYPQKLS